MNKTKTNKHIILCYCRVGNNNLIWGIDSFLSVSACNIILTNSNEKPVIDINTVNYFKSKHCHYLVI